MKFMLIKNPTTNRNREAWVQPKPFGMGREWIRAGDLPELFCSWDLAYRCTNSDWLKPIIQGKRRTIYRLADVLECMKRIEAGELPPARHKRTQLSSS